MWMKSVDVLSRAVRTGGPAQRRRHVPPLLCPLPLKWGGGDIPTHLDCAIDHPPFRLLGRGDQCVEGWKWNGYSSLSGVGTSAENGQGG